ncbi:hypothetical protein B0H11DRAFT_2027376 [Mycena galericulata]|nr:hypothetical protein B0H11DRAFT_2027376 [Mycena galericulata]
MSFLSRSTSPPSVKCSRPHTRCAHSTCPLQRERVSAGKLPAPILFPMAISSPPRLTLAPSATDDNGLAVRHAALSGVMNAVEFEGLRVSSPASPVSSSENMGRQHEDRAIVGTVRRSAGICPWPHHQWGCGRAWGAWQFLRSRFAVPVCSNVTHTTHTGPSLPLLLRWLSWGARRKLAHWRRGDTASHVGGSGVHTIVSILHHCCGHRRGTIRTQIEECGS